MMLPRKRASHPCPCCGCLTMPVPPEDALGFICPVCYWENDVFALADDEPSDCNEGLTLLEGRENFRRLGACTADCVQYTRPPRRHELP